MDANYKTIRVSGPVDKVDKTYVDKIFEENAMMNDLYAGKKRYILDAFCLYKGVGEVNDLSATPPYREIFSFGGELLRPAGFTITKDCIACGICKESCPEDAIEEGNIYKIDEKHCIECGRCYENCPNNAIKPPIGF